MALWCPGGPVLGVSCHMSCHMSCVLHNGHQIIEVVFHLKEKVPETDRWTQLFVINHLADTALCGTMGKSVNESVIYSESYITPDSFSAES